MKFTLIGQDIPTLLPTLLTDLLFAGHQAADVSIEEKNPAMQSVLRGYSEAIFRQSGLEGRVNVSGERTELLRDADCVIYAGDCQMASRFRMDHDALSGTSKEDAGLSDQARVNGGIGGLMHTLRAGNPVMDLCDVMAESCPDALVINLGQPIARTTEIFIRCGFRCYALGRTPLRGANGLDALCKKLNRKTDTVDAVIAGLPGFAFLLSLQDAGDGRDLLPSLVELAESGEFGRLTRRWLDWYGAVAVGDVTDHAEFLPAQPDFIPEDDPTFGETVEQRKERILHMNTVSAKGAGDKEGMMAQLLLLSKAPPIRPMQLGLSLLRGTDLTMEAVTRANQGTLPQLPQSAVIEARLCQHGGHVQAVPTLLPQSLAEICVDVADTNSLAARAAMGDRSALRECVELDPALDGLDRLYCQELVDKLIELHQDVLPRL